MLQAILVSELFWSAVVIALTWTGKWAVGFFVTKYPELKRWKLVEKWETVIALVNQWRRDQKYSDGGDDTLSVEILQAHVKNLCAKYGVSYDDVQAWRRRQVDTRIDPETE